MDKLRKFVVRTAGQILLVPALMLITSTAYSQVPNIGGALKQAAPPPNETKKETPAQEAPVIVQEEEKPFSLPEGAKILIKDFKLEGALKADEPQLSALLEPYRNKELTMAEITEAANKLTLYLRDKGYLVAKAYVPKQDASDGILTIKIIMGNYGKFSLKNTSLVRDFLVQGVFDTAKEASPVVSKDSLERAMMLVKEMPGAQLSTITVAPGAAPGTSDFDVDVEPGPRLTGYVMGDNQGSRYTGKNRLFGDVDVNSPFGIADKFSVSGMTTDANKGLENGRVSYGFPVAYDGLRTEFAVSRTTYSLGGTYSDLDARGTADVAEGTISYPVKRSRDESIDLSLNLAYKKLIDDLSAFDVQNPRRAEVATLGAQRTAYGSLFGHSLATVISAGIDLGRLDFEDNTQQTINEAGANTAGTYSKANLAFSGNLDLNGKFSLRGSVKLQKSLTGNLDPTEQLFISGTTGVKAYTESFSFDNGYVANAELRYALPSLFGVEHKVGLFADNGYVYAQNGNYTTNDKITLTDVGLGYYVNFKQFFGTLQVAQPLGQSSGNTIEADPGTRVLMQVGMSF